MLLNIACARARKLEEACEKTGVKFWGVFSPTQDKWNFVAIMEAEELGDVVKPFREAGGWQENMIHAMSKYFYKTYPKAYVRNHLHF